MLKKISLLFRKKYDETRNKFIRKYHNLKLQGLESTILQAGGRKETEAVAEMFAGNREQITSNIHILTEDAIQSTISEESEEFKKGFRKFGEVYLEFLTSCLRYKIEKENPNIMDEIKKRTELEMIEKTQGKYTTQ